jgi:hypothetical protein
MSAMNIVYPGTVRKERKANSIRFEINMPKAGLRHGKNFSFKKHGGEEGALQAAKTYQQEFCTERGLGKAILEKKEVSADFQQYIAGFLMAMDRSELGKSNSYRKLADEQVGRLLVTTNLAQRHGARTVAMRLLDTGGIWSRLSRRFGRQLFARSLASGGLACRLFRTGH